jgi:very-short-patch-repair endonuclease
MAAVLGCGSGAVLSHRSAGESWGLLPRSSGRLEVTRARGWRAPAGVIVHRSPFRSDEVGVVAGIRVTSVSRTLFDLAAELPKRGVERALNEAEVRRLSDRLSIPDLLDRYPGRRGAATLRDLLASKAPGGIVRNEFEERFVDLLDANRLPRPRFNATLPIRGRLLEVDCLWRQQRLVVELDGRAVHGTDRAFEGDRERDRLLLIEGWRSARVTWRQLRDEPDAIAADLRSLLAAEARSPAIPLRTSYP